MSLIIDKIQQGDLNRAACYLRSDLNSIRGNGNQRDWRKSDDLSDLQERARTTCLKEYGSLGISINQDATEVNLPPTIRRDPQRLAAHVEFIYTLREAEKANKAIMTDTQVYRGFWLVLVPWFMGFMGFGVLSRLIIIEGKPLTSKLEKAYVAIGKFFMSGKSANALVFGGAMALGAGAGLPYSLLHKESYKPLSTEGCEGVLS
jgi:hypothetical protein